MRVRLDNVEWELESQLLEEGKEHLLELARSLATEKGAIISSIQVDGLELEEEAFLALSGGFDIHFITKSIRGLLQESLAEGQSYFPKLIAGLEEVANLFEQGKKDEALRSFSHGLDGISWILQVVDRAGLLLCVRTDEPLLQPLNEDFNHLCGVIAQLSSSLENAKHLEIAYRIREDLLPSLRKLSNHWDKLVALAEQDVQ